IEKALPGSLHSGISGQPPVVVCSDQAHYAVSTAAAWLGLGLDQVVTIPASPNNEIRTCLLESELRRLLKEGRRIAAITATMGTTDAFGLDALDQIRELRDQLAHEFSLDYLPHIHADAVIGWAWSVFREYDFTSNPLQFPDRTLRSLAGTIRRIRHLHLADSIGVDYHKTGFAPYISSAFISSNAADLKLITRDQSATPYLFQSGDYNPGRFTLETSRSGS
ncbi:MAG: pyridoxal-dependent decarboxylase, partial [Planctomycetaceae bacterium]